LSSIYTKLPDKPIIGASGVAGYGHSDRIITKKIGYYIIEMRIIEPYST